MSGEVVAIVPARKGSKRFPRKNIAPLAGRPLVRWTIDAAVASGVFSTIVVSSDDDQVLEIAEKARVMASARPESLAGDAVPVVDVCRYVLRGGSVGSPRAVYVLLPTTPFRSIQSIRDAWQTFAASQADVLLSLSRADYPPQWMLQWDGEIVRPLNPRQYELSRTLLAPAYRHDGAHLIIRAVHLLADQPLLSGRTVGYASTTEESVDIDEPMDLAWAEFLLSRGSVEAAR